jgi:UDP-N-acetyl-D-mannosaminuronic acid transferase (WecB/TagA/CpsF family)
MSQSSLNILIFGIDPKIAESASAQLRDQGIDADALAVSNTPESDTEIAHIVNSKNWDGLIVGHGVRKDQEWFERVIRIVNNTKPNIAVIENKGPNDVKNAVERHFSIKLPLTKA